MIPCLGTDDCIWKMLEQTKVVFQNGIYDLKTGLFEEFTGSPPIFALDAIRTNFVKPDWQELLKFETMLLDIFDNDHNKIALVYQVIGAILSNVALKNIFVFQGISGGGKTALAEIICSLLAEERYLLLTDMPDINNYSKKELMSYKLVFVQDAANKPITSKQDSIFKTYSGGSQLKGMSNFKILICTNHAIYTSQDQGQKLLSRALSERLIVVPFNKSMDRSTARVNAVDYMEKELKQEKELILSRAMVWFSEYFQLGANNTPQYKFHCEYFPNEFIDENVEADY